MEINETDKLKAKAFVDRLLANPALTSYTPLQKEEQIVQFLMVNSSQLYPTLSSKAFFPGQSWENIAAVLLQTLYAGINEEVIPEIRLIVNRLDLTFFTFLENASVEEARAKQIVIDMLIKMLSNEQARRIFAGSIVAVKNGLVRRFVSESFQIRKYVHFEISKVERLKLGEKEAENMISLVLLMKPLIYLFAPQGPASKNNTNGIVFPNHFTENVADTLFAKTPQLPKHVFISAMNSNASFADNSKLEATARMSNIISSMCRNYKPEIKKDRGADTAIKSWINVARKNYKFYGYDLKMLDELYNIASDNGW